MRQGYLALVLHAHLPFVRHPEDEHALEARWLYEAITETYVPLLKVFQRLRQDQVPFAITMSLTPPLVAMLTDPWLQQSYLRHLEALRELADKELVRTRGDSRFHHLAQMYYQLLEDTYRIYHETYSDNLVEAFRELQEAGNLEIIASAATHAYLPLAYPHREAVWAQLAEGIKQYYRHFGRYPRGLWLPECGYHPGDDQIMKQLGIKYFILDAHGILYATPRPRYANYAPIACPNSGVHAFGRDLESSKQVWSAQEGYPGDPDYREFYRDIGYDLPYEYIGPYVHPSGIRTDTGFKYYRITGRSNHKEPYEPAWADSKAAIHAGNFMFNREKQIEWLASHMDRAPIVVSPYDAELFGHWWFEGPRWLDYLIRKVAYDQKVFSLITPSQYLELYPHSQPSQPCMSSWGYNGYNEVWLEGSNDWIYRHLHNITKRMVYLAWRFPQSSGILRRALNQAAREVLLAQASDWPFIMKTGTMVQYARRRVILHVGRFLQLYQQILSGQIDAGWLDYLEAHDNLFPELDYQVFAHPWTEEQPPVPVMAATTS
ncbi:MAG: DUF1957 domain-containing protein [Clostridia bacterium]|nr:DUF1957 domain-containing protein [Clostridia bacterium]